MGDFIKYLFDRICTLSAVILLFGLGFAGSLSKIADVICTELENLFSNIQNETARDAVIIMLVLLATIGILRGLLEAGKKLTDE